MQQSKFFSLNVWDFLKGLLVAVLTAVLTGAGFHLEQGQVPTGDSLDAILIAGIAGGIGYILKQLGTNSTGQLAKKEKTE